MKNLTQFFQKFKTWKEKFSERFDDIQEKARAHWITFSPREKWIVTGLAGVMGLLVVALVVKETSGFFSQVSSNAANNYRNIIRVQTLLKDLSQQRSDLMRYEKLRGKRGENFNLSQFVAAEAGKFGAIVVKTAPTRVIEAPIKVGEKGKAPTKENKEVSEEDWLEVQLKDTTLDSLLKFLSSIEETLGLRVVELKVKPQFSDITKLEVTTIIASQKTL